MDKGLHFGWVHIGAHTGEHLMSSLAEIPGNVLFVEPLPHLFVRLQERFSNNTRIRLENSAVSDTDGQATIEYVDPESLVGLPNWADQLGSLRSGHAEANLREAGIQSFPLATQSVPTLTPKSLLEKHHVGSISFLSIDTEGLDCTILQVFPWNLFRPPVVTFEYKHSDGPLRIHDTFYAVSAMLNQLGYRIKVIDGENVECKHTGEAILQTPDELADDLCLYGIH